jgi:hypothetical protein
MHSDQKRWDEKFRRILNQGETPAPHDWLTSHLAEWTDGPIIDLACGLSAIPETFRHFNDRLNVEMSSPKYLGVDISMVALEWLKDELAEKELQGDVVQADLESRFPLGPVKGLFVLTYFYAPQTFEAVAERARPGSKAIIETFCVGEGEAPISRKYCLEPRELRGYFSGWDIVTYGERKEDHPETARLVAKKS